MNNRGSGSGSAGTTHRVWEAVDEERERGRGPLAQLVVERVKALELVELLVERGRLAQLRVAVRLLQLVPQGGVRGAFPEQGADALGQVADLGWRRVAHFSVGWRRAALLLVLLARARGNCGWARERMERTLALPTRDLGAGAGERARRRRRKVASGGGR